MPTFFGMEHRNKGSQRTEISPDRQHKRRWQEVVGCEILMNFLDIINIDHHSLLTDLTYYRTNKV